MKKAIFLFLLFILTLTGCYKVSYKEENDRIQNEITTDSLNGKFETLNGQISYCDREIELAKLRGNENPNVVFFKNAAIIICFLAIYFIPAFAARRKKYFTGILLLNLFLGWTFVGWVGALIWAVSSPNNIH